MPFTFYKGYNSGSNVLHCINYQVLGWGEKSLLCLHNSPLSMPFCSVITLCVDFISDSRWSQVSSSRHFCHWEHGTRHDGLSVQLTSAAQERKQQAKAAAEKGEDPPTVSWPLFILPSSTLYASLSCGWLLISGSQAASSTGTSQSSFRHWQGSYCGAEAGKKHMRSFRWLTGSALLCLTVLILVTVDECLFCRCAMDWCRSLWRPRFLFGLGISKPCR